MNAQRLVPHGMPAVLALGVLVGCSDAPPQGETNPGPDQAAPADAAVVAAPTEAADPYDTDPYGVDPYDADAYDADAYGADPSADVATTVAAARGGELFEQVCTNCHTLTPPPNLAPPMMGVIGHYRDAFDDRDEALDAMVAYLQAPDPEASKLHSMAIERFGIMPAQPLPEEDLRTVTAWLWDGYDPELDPHAMGGRAGVGGGMQPQVPPGTAGRGGAMRRNMRGASPGMSRGMHRQTPRQAPGMGPGMRRNMGQASPGPGRGMQRPLTGDPPRPDCPMHPQSQGESAGTICPMRRNSDDDEAGAGERVGRGMPVAGRGPMHRYVDGEGRAGGEMMRRREPGGDPVSPKTSSRSGNR